MYTYKVSNLDTDKNLCLLHAQNFQVLKKCLDKPTDIK